MCEYCNTSEDVQNILEDVSIVLGNEIVFEAFVSGQHLELCTKGNYEYPIAEKRIKYCPMCGRKLD